MKDLELDKVVGGATGGVLQLIASDGKQDKLLLGQASLEERLNDIKASQTK